MTEYEKIADLPREKLLELVTMFAKTWVATDGVWFQSVEEKYGFDAALEVDIDMWRRLTVIEAKRVKEFLQLDERPGLDGLRRALAFRLDGALFRDDTAYWEDGALIYRIVDCRVQLARKRKGMAYHTCKPAGVVEYGGFAKTIDDRIVTECLSCHPDVTDPGCDCKWRFTIPGEA